MSRGRRETLRSLTTLLVLGSMTMRLLVFSLLTKMSPVSLADPPEGAAARNAAASSRAASRAGDRSDVSPDPCEENARATRAVRPLMSTGGSLSLAETIAPSVRLIAAAGQD